MDLSSISDIKMSSLLQNSSTHKILSIPLTEIQCLDQVRTNSNKGFDDDSIDELAQSIKNTGLLQPITVRPNPDGQGYLVLWGERRFRDCKKLDLKEIDCIVREDLTKEDDIVLAQFLENEQRNDLSLMEKAAALHRLFEAGIKKKDLAEKLGMPNSNITYIIDKFDLKEDYISTFEKLKQSKSKYNSLTIYYEDSYDILYLKDFKINFNQIKRIIFIPNLTMSQEIINTF